MSTTEWERPGDRRHFVHKRLKRLAGRAIRPIVSNLLPGGGLALDLGSSIFNRGRAAPRSVSRSRAGCETEAGFLRLVNSVSWEEVARQCGTTIAAAKARFAPFRPGFRPPSIPPVNPVREAVVQAKPTPPLKLAPVARSLIPRILPQLLPTLFPAIPTVPAMPISVKLPCLLPFRRDAAGNCVPPFIGSQPGIDPTPVGEPVMGRYGAGYVPGELPVSRAICLPGDVVGNDGICYPKRSIKNADRQWPRGRQPLLTGGEMRAISIAARAAGKFERTQKRLQKLGMIKKPSRPQRIKLPPHQHQITSGG